MRRGFTLIELLVVIAIIGVLSSVVLASLNTARGKGSNAAIKSNLANIRAQTEIYYDTNSNYTAVCTDAGVVRGVAAAAAASGASVGAVDAAGTATTAVCQDSANAWAVQAPLKVVEGTSVYWCVDSTGKSKGEANVIGAGANVCA